MTSGVALPEIIIELKKLPLIINLVVQFILTETRARIEETKLYSSLDLSAEERKNIQTRFSHFGNVI